MLHLCQSVLRIASYSAPKWQTAAKVTRYSVYLFSDPDRGLMLSHVGELIRGHRSKSSRKFVSHHPGPSPSPDCLVSIEHFNFLRSCKRDVASAHSSLSKLEKMRFEFDSTAAARLVYA